ncbi:hypothetical protein B0H12DRAFT_1137904 [Mycena haematopus]|nr:hypothetical protein B0H12DRAFT_1137904 [Mycena haematopus]
MSEPSPYKRTRVFLACLNCRKRKIKCLTNDGQETPCDRCVKKGLKCEYSPVADEQERATHGAGYSSSPRPVSPPAQASSSSYTAEQYRPPYAGKLPYLPSTNQWGPVFNAHHRPQSEPNIAPYNAGQQSPAQYGPYSRAPRGHNTSSDNGRDSTFPYNAVVAPPHQISTSAYPTNYTYPSDWPAFSSSSQPHQCIYPGPCFCGRRG